MQFVKTTRDTVLKPLQIVSGIVERKQTMPILANVLLRKQGDQLTFTATDQEIQIQTTALIGTGNEDAATTVSARKLVDILRALPDAEVQLSLASKKLTIQSGKSRFNLQTLAAEEFPTVAHTEFSTAFTLPAATLKYLLSMVHFAMAAQDIRYYLNGVLLVVEGETIRSVATDGHRLALCEVRREGAQDTNRVEAVIPRKTILELLHLLPDTEEAVHVHIGAKQVKVQFGTIELVSKLVEGKFPDYAKVIPTNNTKQFTIDRTTIMSALARTAILTSDRFKGVRWVLAPGSLKVSATNADQEEAQEEIEIDYSGDNLDIGFNVTYLLDALNNLKCERVQFSLGDALGSTLITMPDSEKFKYVVMPMRI